MANFTNYFDPHFLLCPKDYVKDVKVLYDGTANNGEDYSIALLKWKDDWTLGMRWNRSMREADDKSKNPGHKMCMGVPVSFANPVWFVVPVELRGVILNNMPKHWTIKDDVKEIINDMLKQSK